MNVGARRVAGEVLEVIPLVTRRMAADLRESGTTLKLSYIRLLGTVARKPRTLSELSAFQAVRMPTMSRTVATVENLGWVVRSRSTTHRRVVMVEATAAGRAALREIRDRAIGPISESSRFADRHAAPETQRWVEHPPRSIRGSPARA